MNGAFLPPEADPQQVFPDPAQVEALQGGEAPPEAMPEEGAAPPAEPPAEPEPEGEDLDLEGEIADAIETGCQLAQAALTAEDFMRFSQGVNYLASAFAALQPQADPGEAAVHRAAIETQGRLATEELRGETQREIAASRPTPSQPSARG